MQHPVSTSSRITRPSGRLAAAGAAAALILAGLTPVGPALASPARSAEAAAVAATAAPAAKTAVPAVSATPSSTVARPGARVQVRGQLKNARPKTTVSLQRLHGRTWRTVRSVIPPGDGTARNYSLPVPTTDKGRTVYRVATTSSGDQRAGTSRTFSMLVGSGNPKSLGYLTSPPARWNPCTPVRYRVNLEGAPKGAAADVDAAFRQIAAGTGMRFRKVGTTTVVPGSQGADVPDTYPAGTDIVVAFARPGDPRPARRSAYLPKGSDIVGVGGAFYELGTQRVGGRSWHRIVQGYVVLDRTKKLPTGFGPGNGTGLIGTWGQVLMHELGHVVGLDHPRISDPVQIMYPATTAKNAVWGAGDLVGLHTLGSSSGCFPAARGAGKASGQASGQAADPAVVPLERTGH